MDIACVSRSLSLSSPHPMKISLSCKFYSLDRKREFIRSPLLWFNITLIYLFFSYPVVPVDLHCTHTLGMGTNLKMALGSGVWHTLATALWLLELALGHSRAHPDGHIYPAVRGHHRTVPSQGKDFSKKLLPLWRSFPGGPPLYWFFSHLNGQKSIPRVLPAMKADVQHLDACFYLGSNLGMEHQDNPHLFFSDHSTWDCRRRDCSWSM